MKNGVKFGDKHSIDDWDLLLTSKNIESPKIKTIEVEIPGSDGVKDLTEVFGIKYHNRDILFDFDIFSNPSKWWELHKKISNHLHGKKLKIVLDQDDQYYYNGRCEITSFTNNKSVAHISILCNCEPYKYKITETIKTYETVEGETYNFENLYKEVVPTISVENDIVFIFENNQYSLSAGTHKNLNISLKEGSNIFEIISGNGALTLTYQEASL
jgi:phage-related protein